MLGNNLKKAPLKKTHNSSKLVELTWDGKYKPLPKLLARNKIAEIYGSQDDSYQSVNHNLWHNQLWLGNNVDILQWLVKNKQKITLQGGLKLIYIDPPFDTGSKQDLVIKSNINERNNNWQTTASYGDTWLLPEYLNLLHQSLTLMHKLLDDDGSIFVHCDWRSSAYIRLILDNIFGASNFVNEIIWQSSVSNSHRSLRKFVKSHETIYFYRKSDAFIWNDSYQKYKEGHQQIYRYQDKKGYYQLGPCDSPGGKGYRYELGYGEKTPSRGYCMTYQTARQWIDEGLLVVKKNKVPLKKWYLSTKGVKCKDIWLDIKGERGLIYATQKPLPLLERIILAASRPGDIIADFFCGSGSSLIAANKLKRRFIGIDQSVMAIHTTKIRLLQQDYDPFIVMHSQNNEVQSLAKAQKKQRYLIAQAKVHIIPSIQKMIDIQLSNYDVEIVAPQTMLVDAWQKKISTNPAKIIIMLAQKYDMHSIEKLIRNNPDKTIVPCFYQYLSLENDTNANEKAKNIIFNWGFMWEYQLTKSISGYKFCIQEFSFPKENKLYRQIYKYSLPKIIDYWGIGQNLTNNDQAFRQIWQSSRLDRRKSIAFTSPVLNNLPSLINIKLSNIQGQESYRQIDISK